MRVSLSLFPNPIPEQEEQESSEEGRQEGDEEGSEEGNEAQEDPPEPRGKKGGFQQQATKKVLQEVAGQVPKEKQVSVF